jgi:hypothetical protein
MAAKFKMASKLISHREHRGWIKSGRDKISARGPQMGPNLHHTDEKLKN